MIYLEKLWKNLKGMCCETKLGLRDDYVQGKY